MPVATDFSHAVCQAFRNYVLANRAAKFSTWPWSLSKCQSIACLDCGGDLRVYAVYCPRRQVVLCVYYFDGGGYVGPSLWLADQITGLYPVLNWEPAVCPHVGPVRFLSALAVGGQPFVFESDGEARLTSHSGSHSFTLRYQDGTVALPDLGACTIPNWFAVRGLEFSPEDTSEWALYSVLRLARMHHVTPLDVGHGFIVLANHGVFYVNKADLLFLPSSVALYHDVIVTRDSVFPLWTAHKDYAFLDHFDELLEKGYLTTFVEMAYRACPVMDNQFEVMAGERAKSVRLRLDDLVIRITGPSCVFWDRISCRVFGVYGSFKICKTLTSVYGNLDKYNQFEGGIVSLSRLFRCLRQRQK